jgi:hypothetical protein
MSAVSPTTSRRAALRHPLDIEPGAHPAVDIAREALRHG